jgi:hypothetical protein
MPFPMPMRTFVAISMAITFMIAFFHAFMHFHAFMLGMGTFVWCVGKNGLAKKDDK